MQEMRDGVVCEEIERRFAAAIENLGGVVERYELTPDDQDYAAEIMAERIEQDAANEYDYDEYLLTREVV
jgi:molybdopterin biosynthesis enzyme